MSLPTDPQAPERAQPAFAPQRWVLRRRFRESFVDELRDLALDPVVAKVLYARKIDTLAKARSFLQSEGELGDPTLLAGVPQAVARLCQALRNDEHVVVYGDYDADGACAAALLVSALRRVGGRHVSFFVPNRFTEEYGLSTDALDRLRDERQLAKLLVTVDCGIRSQDEVSYARSKGLEMIVTDHHELLSHEDGMPSLPPALAVINPKRPDSTYPYADLAGVGVAYRLVEALFAEVGAGPDGAPLDPTVYLDLVALGTVADVVPLQGENRLMVRAGLERMRLDPRPGLRALMEVAGVARDKVDSHALGYQLGPRINAAGRLKSGDRQDSAECQQDEDRSEDENGSSAAVLAYDLLLAEDEATARPLAEELNALNQKRQELLERQVQFAEALLGDTDGTKMLLVAHEDLHKGVLGLVASRLVDRHCRPALVMRREATDTRGSARSIEGFHITQALDACGHLLTKYGGHARAAGFSLHNENLEALRDELARYADEHIDADMLCPQHHVDALVSLAEIGPRTPAALSVLGPFGEGNPVPALATQGLVVKSLSTVGRDGQHLRLQVTDGQACCSAIAFRQGRVAAELRPGMKVDLIHRPEMNDWQGQSTLQLVVRAIRLAQGA